MGKRSLKRKTWNNLKFWKRTLTKRTWLRRRRRRRKIRKRSLLRQFLIKKKLTRVFFRRRKRRNKRRLRRILLKLRTTRVRKRVKRKSKKKTRRIKKKAYKTTVFHLAKTYNRFFKRSSTNSRTSFDFEFKNADSVMSVGTPKSITKSSTLSLKNLHYKYFGSNLPLFKYIFASSFKNLFNTITAVKPALSLNYTLKNQLFGTFFLNKSNFISRTNLLPNKHFFTILHKRYRKIASANYSITALKRVSVPYHTSALVNFLAHSTGRDVSINVVPKIFKTLGPFDKARCSSWTYRANPFSRMLGPRIFINESVRLMYLSVMNRDTELFVNWTKAMMNRLTIWKHKHLFRFMKFVIGSLFAPKFAQMGIKGIRMQIKGKVGVAGNSRKRTYFYKVGQVGHSNFQIQAYHDITCIDTFTGVLGFQVWIYSQ